MASSSLHSHSFAISSSENRWEIVSFVLLRNSPQNCISINSESGHRKWCGPEFHRNLQNISKSKEIMTLSEIYVAKCMNIWWLVTADTWHIPLMKPRHGIVHGNRTEWLIWRSAGQRSTRKPINGMGKPYRFSAFPTRDRLIYRRPSTDDTSVRNLTPQMGYVWCVRAKIGTHSRTEWVCVCASRSIVGMESSKNCKLNVCHGEIIPS